MSDEEEKKTYTVKIESGGILSPNLSIKATNKGIEITINQDLVFNTLLYHEDIIKGIGQECKTALLKYIEQNAKRELIPKIMIGD